MGLSDICRLCEAMQAMATGEITATYDKDLRAQIDARHEQSDSRLEIKPLSAKPEPLPDHPRHESGWPVNPFKGLRRGTAGRGGARATATDNEDTLEAA